MKGAAGDSSGSPPLDGERELQRLLFLTVPGLCALATAGVLALWASHSRPLVIPDGASLQSETPKAAVYGVLTAPELGYRYAAPRARPDEAARTAARGGAGRRVFRAAVAPQPGNQPVRRAYFRSPPGVGVRSSAHRFRRCARELSARPAPRPESAPRGRVRLNSPTPRCRRGGRPTLPSRRPVPRLPAASATGASRRRAGQSFDFRKDLWFTQD